MVRTLEEVSRRPSAIVSITRHGQAIEGGVTDGNFLAPLGSVTPLVWPARSLVKGWGELSAGQDFLGCLRPLTVPISTRGHVSEVLRGVVSTELAGVAPTGLEGSFKGPRSR